jgi:hypothetical protein
MPRKTIHQLNAYNKATGAVYNHSNTKLNVRKNKVRRCRKDAFLSVLPCRGLSSYPPRDESKPSSTRRKSKSKPFNASATSNTKQKLQVFVRTRLPRGSKTLYFELVSGTLVKSLKELIRRRVRVLPQHQHLHTKRNIELLDFLTLRENGVEDNDLIMLSTNNPSEEKPKGEC